MTIEKFKDEIISKESEYGSIPFWSWNDKLEEKELRRQICNMKELGMHGFFMHARGGLGTGYLSDEWYDAVKACIDEAEKHDMEAWLYDENGWPSGFGGGALLHDPYNFASYLECESTDVYPAPDDDILGVYRREGGAIVPLGDGESAVEYIVVRRRFDNSYVDTLNEKVTEKFIASTHEMYEKKLEAHGFGTRCPGFFTDEPQYYRYATPWSDIIPEIFEKEYGYPVSAHLPALFLDCEGDKEFRYDYYLLCHKLFINAFPKTIYDWCERHGVKLTGHAVEEASIDGQMWCCGGVMPFYLYEHIPGIDYLGRGISDELAPRQLGTVCEQTGKKKALSEMFACCGWDITPRELKRIADLQYCGGVNLMCQHLYAYSERGERKRDYPLHYSEHNTWQKYLADFNRFYARLGAALASGKEIAPVLVLHPIRSAYLTYKRKSGGIDELESALHELVSMLSRERILYHFGDEDILEMMGEVDGNRIRVGLCEYSAVIVPYCETLSSNTVRMLREYITAGGAVWCSGRTPDRVDGRPADLSFIRSNTTLNELKKLCGMDIRFNGGKELPLRQIMKQTEHGRELYIANVSEKTARNVELLLDGWRGAAELDPATLKVKPLRGERTAGGKLRILLDIYDSQSYLIIEDGDTALAKPDLTPEPEYLSLPRLCRFIRRPENMMTLDYARISKDGGEAGETLPLMCIKDNLLSERYRGRLKVEQCFDADFIPERLFCVAEPLKYLSFTVNGNPVDLVPDSRIDRSFLSADISSFVRVGNNVISYEIDYFQDDYVYYVLYGGVSETLRNCLCFNVEIEPIYLFGSFCVESRGEWKRDIRSTLVTDGPFVLREQRPTVDIGSPLTDGYPFFGGCFEVETELEWKEGDPEVLRLGGRFAVCECSVNGKDAGVLMFDDRCDLHGMLHRGKNKVKLSMINSRRNLLGPHHFTEAEPMFVSPFMLSGEKKWKGTKCDEYLDRYAFVRFGTGDFKNE